MTARRTIPALAGLLALLAPAARADVYVANSNSNNLTVSLERPSCGFFSGIVPVGPRPVAVAVSPDGRRAYTTNMSDGSVSVLDTSLPAVVATVQVGGSPFGPVDAVVHPDGSRLYVLSNNRVAVVNTASLTVTTSIFVIGFANRIAIHPTGNPLYVTTAGGYLEVIDTSTNTVTAHLPVSANPFGVAVNPAGTRLYVVGYGAGGFVAVIDAVTHATLTTIPVEGVPEAVAVNLAGTRLFVTNNMNQAGVPYPGKLTVIDAATHAVMFAQTIDANPYGVAADRTNVYVSTADGGGSQNYTGHLWAFDAGSGAFRSRREVGGIPAGVATFVNPQPPPLPASVRVTGIEVTQAVQDVANSVTLVAGRRTFVRVHVKAEGASVPNVTATLFGVGTACVGTFCEGGLIGSLTPANSTGARLTVKGNPQRRKLDDSFLFELPWAWIDAGSLRLVAVLHTDPGPPAATCRTDAPATGAAFEPGATLKIQFIRLAYAIGGVNVSASDAEQKQSEAWIRRAYPLSTLVPGPDWQIFYPGLGSRVDRSADECQDMDAEDRSLCAQRWVTPKLALANVLGAIPGGAHGAYGLIPQYSGGACAPAPGGSMPCFTRGACCTSGVGAGPSNDPDYAAHEIGHLLGRQHPVHGDGTCGHDGVDEAYPYALSLIHPLPYDDATSFAGFDVGDAALSMPISVPDTTKGPYDIMGYCSPEWISDYTYRALYYSVRALNVPGTVGTHRPFDAGTGARRRAARAAPTAEAGDWLAVFGSITPGLPAPASVELRRVDRVAFVPPRVPGGYSIRLIGPGGATLADHPFTPDVAADANPVGEASAPLVFGHVVPFAPGTAEVRIVNVAGGDVVVASRAVTAGAPTVSGVTLVGAPDPVTGPVTLTWTAGDPDGGLLRFDVLVTRDAGASYQALVLDAPGTSVPLDTSWLGGGTARFRVVATDGAQSGYADSPPYVLAPKPPRPHILTPGGPTILRSGQLLNLEGEAADPQDGAVPAAGLSWSIPGRALGLGARLSVSDLPVGVVPVTLTATNSLGLAATTTVLVVVNPATTANAPALSAEPRRIGWHVAAGDTELQAEELQIDSTGGALDFTAESTAPWLTLSASAGTTPATLTITADPGGFAGGATLEAGVTVTAADQAVTVPVRLSVGNTFVVGNAEPLVFDLCPGDPAKARPGACGCGVPDDAAGEACSTGRPGVCAPGVFVCVDSGGRCAQAVQPSPEIADGLDNDCDGKTDEGTRRPRKRSLVP